MAARLQRGLRPRNARGAAAVEFALIVPILLVLVFGMIQYGWYFFAMQSGTSATSDAVRRLSVGDCQNSVELKALIADRLGAAKTSSSVVVATPTFTSAASGHPTVAAPGEIGGGVTLQVQFDTANFHFPFIPVPDDGTVTRTIFARVEDTTASAGGCS